jgi:hypothetical protein
MLGIFLGKDRGSGIMENGEESKYADEGNHVSICVFDGKGRQSAAALFAVHWI